MDKKPKDNEKDYGTYQKSFKGLDFDKAKYVIAQAERKLDNTVKAFDDIENKNFKLIAFQGVFYLGLMKILYDSSSLNSYNHFGEILIAIAIILSGFSLILALLGFSTFSVGVSGNDAKQFAYNEKRIKKEIIELMGYYAASVDRDISHNNTVSSRKSNLLIYSVIATVLMIFCVAAIPIWGIEKNDNENIQVTTKPQIFEDSILSKQSCYEFAEFTIGNATVTGS